MKIEQRGRINKIKMRIEDFRFRIADFGFQILNDHFYKSEIGKSEI